MFLPGKATVVWNGSSGGVDIERFNYDKRKIWRKQIRSELGYGEEDFVYGFVGRITRDKGINELLEAFFRMDNNSKLLLIGPFEGENTLNQELLKKAKNNESILFHSSVREIEKYYAAIDVLVLPSYREGFGNVVIEAGAVGTPAIVSNIPGPIDAIDNNNTALTVKVCDSEDLMKKMQKIKEINYKLMGENAEKYSREKFDSRVLSRKIYERKTLYSGGGAVGKAALHG